MRSPTPMRRLVILALVCAAAPAAWAQHGGGGGAAGASGVGRGVGAGVGSAINAGATVGRGVTNRADTSGVTRGVSQSARAMAQGPVALGARERRSYARALRREYGDVLDFDSRDQLIVRGQIVAVPSSPDALSAAEAAGFRLVRASASDGLGVGFAVLEAPAGRSLRRAIKQLRRADPEGAYDFNHVYFESGAAATAPTAGGPVYGAGTARGTVRIGLVDGGLAPAHPALQGLDVRRHGCDGEVRPSTHGTAVASLLRATLGPELEAPVELYAADVYCGRPTGGAVTELAEALDWLVQQQVPVVNVSLVGPPNVLLERSVAAARARGVLVVAAVGNDGPAAPPLYPAGYPAAVAVTGVDGNARLLIEAGRGTHVDFAAPGADVEAASLPEGFEPVRGTSFAAPVVAASLARLLARPDPRLADQALATLARSAVDLGPQGFDPRFGHGCVGCAAGRQAQADR